ncbi:NGG1p interacting factor 3 [Lentinula detonsa]|uniref:NGG1p interacting factor 3 n=1 Tax=Lentinula detonsa TaxID=2804962 RepID=A0A9W8NXM3_9AGAR|nr:NGG1p interacting factor 3 [Lentinula detonsa]KAJ3793363.1 NGG1p interacting factor 3 [Lentinula aff. detonsa]
MFGSCTRCSAFRISLVSFIMSSAFLKAVSAAMERIAPLRLAESFDNVGLLLETPLKQIKRHRVMLTIDLTTAVVDESIAAEASLIVAYHPTIFGALKSFTLGNPLQASLLRCAAHGISVYCPHTALDCTWGGINDWLAEGVMGGRMAGTVRPLQTEKFSPTGDSDGALGRLVTLRTPATMEMIEKRVKDHLKLSQIQVGYATTNDGRKSSAMVETIAICAGSGGSVFAGKEADVYFTGEMQHHEVLSAVAAGTNVILCGHTNTERGYLPILASKLEAQLDAADYPQPFDVVISTTDKHPLEFV